MLLCNIYCSPLPSHIPAATRVELCHLWCWRNQAAALHFCQKPCFLNFTYCSIEKQWKHHSSESSCALQKSVLSLVWRKLWKKQLKGLKLCIMWTMEGAVPPFAAVICSQPQLCCACLLHSKSCRTLIFFNIYKINVCTDFKQETSTLVRPSACAGMKITCNFRRLCLDLPFISCWPRFGLCWLVRAMQVLTALYSS